MTITRRLLLNISVALLAMLTVGGFGAWQLNQAQARFYYVEINTFPSLKVMTDALRATTDMRAAVFKELLNPTPAQKADLDAVIADADRRFDAVMADYMANDLSNDADKQLTLTDEAAMAKYRTARQQVLALAQNHQPDPLRDYVYGEFSDDGKAVIQDLVNHYKFNTDLADGLFRDNSQAYTLSLILLGAIIACVLLISGLLGAHLYHIIKRGLGNIQGTLQQVCQTMDFTRRAPVERMDEIGVTAIAFNTLLEHLQHTMKNLRGGAQSVARAALTLAQTARDVSQAATEQSAAASNMAATVEQMTVSVNHVGEQASYTYGAAQEASKLVEDGTSTIGQTIGDIHQISEVVKTSASSIHELESYSAQVSAVVSVIRDIADQTNLLALNAAIEAARAGEQGRGFAVVADEVRKLAERTARSTQEISTTIETMVARSQQATSQMLSAEQLVTTGVARADNADQAIKRIGENVAGATRALSAIAAAIKQQGVASNNIATQVEHSAQMSEQASVGAKHAAESAAQLDELARAQMTALSQYTI